MTGVPTPPPAGFDPNTNPKAAAKAAQAYAKATRPWYKKKRFVIPGAILVIGGIASAAGGGKSSETTPTSGSSVQTPTSPSGNHSAAKPSAAALAARQYSLTVSAPQIVDDYSSNELAADTKYKGKTIKVTGFAHKIDTDVFNSDRYNLIIDGGGDFEMGVTCNNMNRGLLNQIKVGGRVAVIGLVTDGGDLGVNMNDCGLA